MVEILIGAGIIGIVGLIIGVFLGIAADKFYVKTDEREAAIRSVLPGNNCGGCGFPGCDGLAAAIAKGEVNPNACPVGGGDVADKISEIMGIETTEAIRMTAFVKCAGDCESAKKSYDYSGVYDCEAAMYTAGNGPKACSYGCTGFGNCVNACPFDAIHVEDGVAVVDKEECKACGKCVAACPKHLIELVPYQNIQKVRCNSKEFGKNVKAVCSKGCIGCGICERLCKNNAISVKDHLATIDYEKCTGCGACAEKCPAKIISIE